MRRGFLLVMVAGVLTLLALTSVVFLQLSRFAGLSAHVGAAGVESRLAAESGLAYAAGRLWESTDRFPGTTRLGEPGFDINASRKATVANRGDDWHYRGYDRDNGSWFEGDQTGSLPVDWLDPLVEETPHPSYAHGEAWKEEIHDGLFDTVSEAWNDADGNGRRDVYTGRLRGPKRERLFTLRVEPGTGCKLPINVTPKPDDGFYESHRELLNRLGAVLGIRRVEVLSGNGLPLRWSDLGDHLYQAHPVGGWKQLEDLRGVLTESEFRSVRRFITVAPPLDWERHLSMTTFPRSTPQLVVYDTMNLNGAPLRLLEAHLRFRFAAEAVDRIAHGLFDALPSVTDPHTGLPYTAHPTICVLHPPEAHRAATGLHVRTVATGGFRSRHELFRHIDWQKQAWFPNDILYENPFSNPPPTHPSEGYQNMKADMTFGSFFPARQFEAPSSLATFDVDRFVRHASGYPGGGRHLARVPLMNEPFLIRMSGSPFTGNQPWEPGTQTVGSHLRWSLSPPVVFDVASWAPGGPQTPSARAEGSCHVANVLFLGRQEDFANLNAYPLPWGNPSASPAGVRRTTRGFEVHGIPTYTGNASGPDVTTLQDYPRETYDGIEFFERGMIGGLALARASTDLGTVPPGGSLLAYGNFDCGPFLDSAMQHQLTLTGPGLDPPKELVPVSRSGADTSTEKCGDGVNDAGMDGMLSGSSAYGISLRANDRFSFYQNTGANNPNGLPALPFGSIPVPGPLMSNDGSVGDGDFRAITNLLIQFTYTGTLTTTFGTPFSNSGEAEIFTLRTPPNEFINQRGGDTCMRLLKCADGNWVLDVLQGVAIARDPARPAVNKRPWGDPLWQKGTGSLMQQLEQGHTTRFRDAYRPLAASDLPLLGDMGFPQAFWEETSAVHRITVFYFAEDDDASYPPLRIRSGIFIDDQRLDALPDRLRPLADYHWQYNPVIWDLASNPGVVDDCTYPRAEMFYRVGGLGGGGINLASDGRRILDVQFQRCTDLVFARAPGGNSPTISSAYAYAEDFHKAYCASRDFFRRTGTFTSARYVLPEPMPLEEVNWGGVLPQVLWEKLSSPEDALVVDFHAYDRAGSPMGTFPLRFKKMEAGTAGTEAFFLPLGTIPAPLRRRKVASFRFEVRFDVSDWDAAGGASLLETPSLEEMWIRVRAPVRWLAPSGPPITSQGHG